MKGMKLVLTLADTEPGPETDEAVADLAQYVVSIQGAIERKLFQGFPGLLLERGDSSVWVKKVEIVLDTEPDKA